MAKKTKTSTKRKAPEPDSDPKIDFEDVQMSDSDAESEELDTTVEIEDEDEYAAEARALKAAMEEGAFDKLVGEKIGSSSSSSSDEEEDEEQKTLEAAKAANAGFTNNVRGLNAATAQILARELPWEERLDVTSAEAGENEKRSETTRQQ